MIFFSKSVTGINSKNKITIHKRENEEKYPEPTIVEIKI